MSTDKPGPPAAEKVPAEAWSYEQELAKWKAKYEELQKKAGGLEQAGPIPKGAERRQDPRYSFRPDTRINIFAHLGPKAFPIVNVSVGGVAFYAEQFFEPGTNVLLSALGMVALDVYVVGCEMVETSEVFMEYQYLVRAKFSSRVNGYLVYVLSREAFLKQGVAEGG